MGYVSLPEGNTEFEGAAHGIKQQIGEIVEAGRCVFSQFHGGGCFKPLRRFSSSSTSAVNPLLCAPVLLVWTPSFAAPALWEMSSAKHSGDHTDKRNISNPIESMYGIFTYMKTIKINHSCR